MKRIVSVSIAVAALAGGIANIAPASGDADGEASRSHQALGSAGYRDWRLISVNHLAGSSLKQVRAQLGNDIAIKSFREGKLPFPDGTIIAALHWNEASSERKHSLSHRLSRRRPSIFRCRVRRECPVHGQGFEEVCHDRRLGICRLHERQTWQRGAAQHLLPLPPACERSRLRFHPLRALVTAPTVKSYGSSEKRHGRS